jgi:hypothetical protein
MSVRTWFPALLIASLVAVAATGCGGGAAENPPATGAPPAVSTSTGGHTVPARPAEDAGQAAQSMATGWRYRFEMTNPPNDNFGVTTREVYLYFKPDTTAVYMQIENRLGIVIKILWDEMTFRDVYGRTFKAVHRGITYDKRDLPQEPTYIQPNQRYSDFVIPVDLLQVPEAASGEGIRELLPTDLGAQSLVGKTFGFTLVLAGENDARLNYDVQFRIVSVVPPR